MKILHYALGFPPYRSGGLTKFCVDLMIQQAKSGQYIGMIWPGRIKITDNKVKIKKDNVMIGGTCIDSYEIINPLPVPYDEGITYVDKFIEDADEKTYLEFLKEVNPDVIHIHTLMGLHKSLLSAAKRRKIKLVFTAHDFFPICPKVTMFCNGTVCKNSLNFSDCRECNLTALSINKIKFLQTGLYRNIKDSTILKKIRKIHRDNYLSNSCVIKTKEVYALDDRYKRLRQYYYSLLSMIDIIHYNSNVTKDVYEKFFELPNNCVIYITHADIQDNRKVKNFSKEKIRIRYLGPQSDAKGFFLLQHTLDKLWEEKQNFSLDIHFVPLRKSPYMNINERYSYSEFDAIFDKSDVVVVPSIWYETFGFTVLEALSYGVPVIVSGTVGAKEILESGGGIIVDNISESNLYEIFERLDLKKLKKMNEQIVKKQKIESISEMEKLIRETCY